MLYVLDSIENLETIQEFFRHFPVILYIWVVFRYSLRSHHHATCRDDQSHQKHSIFAQIVCSESQTCLDQAK